LIIANPLTSFLVFLCVAFTVVSIIKFNIKVQKVLKRQAIFLQYLRVRRATTFVIIECQAWRVVFPNITLFFSWREDCTSYYMTNDSVKFSYQHVQRFNELISHAHMTLSIRSMFRNATIRLIFPPIRPSHPMTSMLAPVYEVGITYSEFIPPYFCRLTSQV
jgi:hypothetical protein